MCWINLKDAHVGHWGFDLLSFACNIGRLRCLEQRWGWSEKNVNLFRQHCNDLMSIFLACITIEISFH